MANPLIRLQCGCNSYEWGKVGQTSAAARFASATNFSVDDSKPYAELWMGTHPSLPSKDVATGQTLASLVQANRALLSPSIAARFDAKLPFLFKVLSISKALSIQAHPNKRLAEQLHARDSKNYPDDNHKPEMTIAVTPFDGLCGFRPLAEIAHFLRTVAPLRQLVGDAAAAHFEQTIAGHEETTDAAQTATNKAALQQAFTALMSHSTDTAGLTSATEALVALANADPVAFAAGGTGPNTGEQLARLVVRLHGQFPNDIGSFVFFFLNYVELDVGEAMFLRADDVHAYLSGDIIECMAASDNVVRAGFTPKFKDTATLTSMLTYSYAPIAQQKMVPQEYPYATLNVDAYRSGSSCLLYDPPIDEFAVVRTEIKAQGGKATFEGVAGPSIIICTGGSGTIAAAGKPAEEIKEGWVYFVGASSEVVLEAGEQGSLTTYKAFCELANDESGANGHVNGKM